MRNNSEGLGMIIQRGPQGSQAQETIDRLLEVRSGVSLDKSFVTRQIIIGVKPTFIVETFRPMGYVMVNPGSTAPGISGGVIPAVVETTHLPLAERSGIDQLTPFIDTTLYEDMHVFLQITAISGGSGLTVEFLEQDIEGEIYVTSVEWVNLNSIGNRYVFLGSLGIARRFGLRWTVLGFGTVTFAIRSVLKCPCIAGGDFLTSAIFLGNSNQVTLANGWAFIPGESISFTMRENSRLFGIASKSQTLHLLEMGV